MAAAIIRLYHTPWIFFLESVVVLVLPTLLALNDSHFLNYRHLLMGLGLIYVVCVIRILRLTVTHLGLSTNCIKRSLTHALPLTLGAALVFVAGFHLYPQLLTNACQARLSFTRNWTDWQVIGAYVFYSVPLQEFLFRSYVISRLKLLTKNSGVIIFISATLFALAHLPFMNLILSLGTFPLGLWLGYLYLKHTSLAGPILAHALLGGIFLYQLLHFCG